MKILHTSDWHIGKKLGVKSRLLEQREILGEIQTVCDNEGVDVLLVSGDVFDTFVPSSEAEEIFFEYLIKLATPERAVVIISGNHDDWQRLSAPANLASKYNAYIFGGENIPTVGGGLVKAERIGKNFIEIKKGSEGVFIGILPYPGEARVGEKKNDLTYQQKISAWIEECFENNVNGLPQILCSHIFMLGGEKTTGERDIELGGARIVEPSCVSDKILYTALGHLHKRQVVKSAKNIIYSGSPLQYAFDEVGQEKSVTLFEICENSVQNLKIIPLLSGKKLVKLVANNLEDATALLKRYEDSHVYLTLKLKEVLSESESRELMGGYPQLAELNLQIESDYTAVEWARRKELNDKELFEEYYKSKTGEEAPEDLMEIYLKAISGDIL